MAKDRKPENDNKLFNFGRQIATPKSSLKVNKPKPPKKDDKK